MLRWLWAMMVGTNLAMATTELPEGWKCLTRIGDLGVEGITYHPQSTVMAERLGFRAGELEQLTSSRRQEAILRRFADLATARHPVELVALQEARSRLLAEVPPFGPADFAEQLGLSIRTLEKMGFPEREKLVHETYGKLARPHRPVEHAALTNAYTALLKHLEPKDGFGTDEWGVFLRETFGSAEKLRTALPSEPAMPSLKERTAALDRLSDLYYRVDDIQTERRRREQFAPAEPYYEHDFKTIQKTFVAKIWPSKTPDVWGRVKEKLPDDALVRESVIVEDTFRFLAAGNGLRVHGRFAQLTLGSLSSFIAYNGGNDPKAFVQYVKNLRTWAGTFGYTKALEPLIARWVTMYRTSDPKLDAALKKALER